MSKHPVIRKAALSDACAIQECVKAAYSPYIARIGKPPGPMLDDYREVMGRHAVYVAEMESIVGVLVLIKTQAVVLLDNVAVHPDWQGGGLGKRLIQFAEANAISNGYKKLDTYTHERMDKNIKLYESLGYSETERKTVRGYDRVYMRKVLI